MYVYVHYPSVVLLWVEIWAPLVAGSTWQALQLDVLVRTARMHANCTVLHMPSLAICSHCLHQGLQVHCLNSFPAVCNWWWLLHIDMLLLMISACVLKERELKERSARADMCVTRCQVGALTLLHSLQPHGCRRRVICCPQVLVCQPQAVTF